MTNKKYRHFNQWFTYKTDLSIEDFTMQPDEVVALKWISPQNLEQDIKENPEDYLPSMLNYLRLFH